MGVLRQGLVELYDDEKSFIAYVKSNDFPWYHIKSTDNFTAMSHLVMMRPDEPVRGAQNSPHLPAAEDLFLRICGDNYIDVKCVHRIAFNLTFADPSPHGDIHLDHMFPHKNFILYLNKFDGGDTYLFNEDAEIIETIKQEENKFVVFGGDLHAQGFCNPQQHRILMVVTFTGDINSSD